MQSNGICFQRLFSNKILNINILQIDQPSAEGDIYAIGIHFEASLVPAYRFDTDKIYRQ